MIKTSYVGSYTHLPDYHSQIQMPDSHMVVRISSVFITQHYRSKLTNQRPEYDCPFPPNVSWILPRLLVAIEIAAQIVVSSEQEIALTCPVQ